MAETFCYVTVLSLDVIGYCLLVSLGGGDTTGGRNKLKGESEEMLSPKNWGRFIPHAVLTSIAAR